MWYVIISAFYFLISSLSIQPIYYPISHLRLCAYYILHYTFCMQSASHIHMYIYMYIYIFIYIYIYIYIIESHTKERSNSTFQMTLFFGGLAYTKTGKVAEDIHVEHPRWLNPKPRKDPDSNRPFQAGRSLEIWWLSLQSRETIFLVWYMFENVSCFSCLRNHGIWIFVPTCQYLNFQWRCELLLFYSVIALGDVLWGARIPISSTYQENIILQLWWASGLKWQSFWKYQHL